MPSVFTDKGRKNNHYLQMSEAEDRKGCIKDVNYEVTLCMPKGQQFYGHVVVEFFLFQKHPSKKLYLDFRGDKIGMVKLNGFEYDEDKAGVFENHRILLEPAILQEG
jgi:hypothetical protein